MDILWNENEEQQMRMLNGRSVMNALAFMQNEATENELCEHIITLTGQPDDLVKQEVKRILHYGINNGFLVKNGKNFSLPSSKNVYHVDNVHFTTQKDNNVFDENIAVVIGQNHNQSNPQNGNAVSPNPLNPNTPNPNGDTAVGNVHHDPYKESSDDEDSEGGSSGYEASGENCTEDDSEGGEHNISISNPANVNLNCIETPKESAVETMTMEI